MKSCFCGPTACWFKLSLFGVIFSFLLALLGIIPAFNSLTVQFPVAWLMSMFLLIISITLYFNVKDRFWAEVMENKAKGRNG